MFRKLSVSHTVRYGAAVLTAAFLWISAAAGQELILVEDFDAVTETGGGDILVGPGFELFEDWDDGITGETAFAGTTGYARFGAATVAGDATAGVGGSGAGVLGVSGVSYDVLWHDFALITGTGGGEFLAGGAGPDTFNSTSNWDDGIAGEFAFGGTFGGAVLNGSMSAAGVIGGGLAGTNGARLDVDDVSLNGGGWYAGLQWDIGPFPGSAYLENDGFETGGGWTAFANAYMNNPAIEIAPRTGTGAAKLYGAFTGPSGLYQEFDVQPGQVWQLSAWAYAPSWDPIAGTENQAQLRIEWRDGEDIVATEILPVLDGLDPNMPQDTWISAAVSGTAPAGAATARVLLYFEQPAGEDGAVWFDDAAIKVTGPGSVDLSQHALTVDVKGTADGPDEVLGGVQLRVEDPAGNRLVYEIAAASGAWETIGDALTNFVEADPNGDPAVDAFNRNASEYHVVLAFADDFPWGTGGTLEVDNLLLSNTNTAGSTWYTGTFWDGLEIPIVKPDEIKVLDPSRLLLLADMKGNKVAPYALRLEAMAELQSALDKDFSGAVGDCGNGDPNNCYILNATLGETTGFSNNFDSGIEGEAAFAGTDGPVSPFGTEPGVHVSGDPAGFIRLQVQGLNLGLDATWYAGFDFGDQAFASNDLSQVELRADVRAWRAPLLGGLGWYELRIEDAEKDRLVFQVDAAAVGEGVWQSVGGTLDTAVELPPADPALPGDGFDTNDASYNVVIAFVDEPDKPLPTTWAQGGILEVDNLYLTPATSSEEIGRFEFVADGSTSFETVGGLLSTADTITLEFEGQTNGDVTMDFEDGVPGDLVTQNVEWDPGLDNEGCFFGLYGASTIDAQIQTCADCGVGGSQAVRTLIDQTGNTWWSGFYFTDIPLDLSAGADGGLAALTDVTLSAMMNAAGSTLPYGVVVLRIEDDETDFIGFELEADGTWQLIGGPLSNAFIGCADPGDCADGFDYLQETYTITVAITNFTTPQWGGLIDVVVDDITYTGGTLFVQAPDAFTVTGTFADEVAAWGDDGELTIDNVVLTVVPNCNADESLDLRDLAMVQACFGSAGCECGDMNGDDAADTADAELLLEALSNVPPAVVLP